MGPTTTFITTDWPPPVAPRSHTAETISVAAAVSPLLAMPATAGAAAVVILAATRR